MAVSAFLALGGFAYDRFVAGRFPGSHEGTRGGRCAPVSDARGPRPSKAQRHVTQICSCQPLSVGRRSRPGDHLRDGRDGGAATS